MNASSDSVGFSIGTAAGDDTYLAKGEAFLEKPLTPTGLLGALAFVMDGELFPPGGPSDGES